MTQKSKIIHFIDFSKKSEERDGMKNSTQCVSFYYNITIDILQNN